MTEVILYLAILGISYVGVDTFRRWSHRRGIIDHPNERSSHAIPTPRGSGIVIFVLCMTAYIAACLVYGLTPSMGFVSGAILLAGISWLDDVYSIPVFIRLPVQSIAAILVILDLGYFQRVDIPLVGAVEFGTFGAVLTFGWIVWMLNAYNFMDGIDGLAGMQAVIAGAGWLIIAYFTGSNTVYIFGGAIAFASVGFLLHNWEPANVFMGDVGSSFLGYAFAVMPLLVFRDGPRATEFIPVAAVLLVWLFVVDTIYTFIRRSAGRQKVWAAHREHIYQKLVIARVRHSTVTLVYSAVAVVISVLTVFRVRFGGEVDALLVFFIVAGPVLIAVWAYRKKRIDVS